MSRKSDRKRERKEKVARRVEEERARTAGKNCYCGPDDEYCSTCEVCGRPGHLRHFPGAVPVTGSWCDAHYLRLRLLHPMGSVGCWLHLVVLVGLVVVLFRFL